MKVIINTCFGGFGLSAKAVARIAELKGKTAYFFLDGFGNKPYKPVNIDEIKDNEFFTAFYSQIPDRNNYISDQYENRSDETLVAVVEELGSKANGQFARLKIIDIPDGVDFEIHDYDGVESIHEKHMQWY